MTMLLSPIARVQSARRAPDDDPWGLVIARIVLDERVPADALHGLAEFSHVEVLFHLHLVAPESIIWGARHPRENPEWPRVGILAQRASGRPNRLGSTMVELLDVEARAIVVRGLDAIDGSPVLDLRPVMREFLPRGAIRQPSWATALMRDYWCGGRT